MRSLCFTALLFYFINAAQAQSPDWLWAKSAGGTGQNISSSITVDANSNVYVTGNFFGSNIIFGNDTLTGTNNNNVFIVKYNSSGNVIWAKSTTGTGGGVGYGISTDANGSAYVTGEFGSPNIVFGSDTLTNNSYDNRGNNIFIVKYDSSGNVIWAKSAGETGFSIADNNSNNVGYGISIDASSNVYVTGSFTDTVVFGTDTLINDGIYNFFIVKYNSSGNVIWAKNTVAGNDDIGIGISTDVNSNVYVTGSFNSAKIVFGNDTLINAGGFCVFIVKYDSSGNVIWARNASGTGNDYGEGISVDFNGNVYVTGDFNYRSIIFGADTLSCAGSQNVFIVKYDPNGNVIWAKSAGGLYGDMGNGISIDVEGNPYIIGTFASTTAFGSDTLTNAGGGSGIFIVKYDPPGNVIWAKSTGGSGQDNGLGISIDANGNPYVVGIFTDTVAFRTDTLTDITSAFNIFVAKLANPIDTVTKKQTNKLTIYPNPSNGNFYFSGVQSGYTIEVYDVLGERIYSAQANSDKYAVSLSGQAKGMYIYKVSDNAGAVQQGKMVVE
jgi:hypothetical protein